MVEGRVGKWEKIKVKIYHAQVQTPQDPCDHYIYLKRTDKLN